MMSLEQELFKLIDKFLLPPLDEVDGECFSIANILVRILIVANKILVNFSQQVNFQKHNTQIENICISLSKIITIVENISRTLNKLKKY